MDAWVSFIFNSLFYFYLILFPFFYRDVVFVEDVRSVPVGRVLKVDGQYAAVRFPTPNTSDVKDDNEAWQDCRLMKKDDLTVNLLKYFI